MSRSYEDSFSGRVMMFFGVIIAIAVTIIGFAVIEINFVAYPVFFFIFYLILKGIWNLFGWFAHGATYDAGNSRTFTTLMWFLYVAGAIAYTYGVATDVQASP